MKLERGDIKTISAEYGLDVIDFVSLSGGSSNTNYLLHTESAKYVLTVFDNKSAGEATRIGQVLILLMEKGFPATGVLPTVLEDEISIYRGRPLIVREFVPGNVHQSLNDEMLTQVGQTMAHLHQIPAPDFMPRGYAYGWQLFPEVINRGIDPEYEAWLGERHVKFRDRLPKNLPCGLIHADIFPDNLLFEGNVLRAIIDFEDVSHYPYCFDLGMSILGLCSDMASIDYEKVRLLIAAYQAIRTIEIEEKNSLQIFLDYAATALSYWRFWKYNIFSPVEARTQLHRQPAHIAEQVSQLPKETFIKMVFE